MQPKSETAEHNSPAESNVHIKRIYAKPVSRDGYRVLVDRLWPRGVTHESAKLDQWLQSIAPSTELRKWFDHDPLRWEEFRQRYYVELQEHRAELQQLGQRAGPQRVTLLYAARDPRINHAVVIQEAILQLRE